MSKSVKPRKKRANLRIGKEIYGTKPIEEAFREAFAPYFTKVEVNKKEWPTNK